MEPVVNIKDYTAKSIVLRSVPNDYFKPYSGRLTEVGGKWNPYLKEPPGSQNVLGGWIFQKTKENEVRQVVQQITDGQVDQTPIMTSSPPHPAIYGSLQHSGLTRAVVPLATRQGYQQIEVIKPEVGATLYLEMNGQKYPVTVETVQEDQGIMTSAGILLQDGQRTQISIQRPQWKITGFTQEHSIVL